MNSDLMIDKIMYITHNEDSFKIHYTFEKCYENICSYYTLIKSLGDNFLRINDTTIINFEYITKCTEKKITVINGATFDVSPKYQKNATNKFFKMKLEKFTAGV